MSGLSAPGSTLRGLVVATMFRGDPTQLLQWCNIHLNAGADALYVVLDRPPAGLLESLPQDPRLHWEVVGEATWARFYPSGRDNVERKQVDAIRWLMRRAAAEGHRHLAFLDTDELLDLAVPFTDLAARHADASALTVPPREMWFDGPERVTEPFGATLALRPATRGVAWSRILGWRAQYLRNGMLGHDAGKTIYRLPVASGMLSVHGPLSGLSRSRAVTLSYDEGQLLHFDCGSLATWNAKWAARLSGDTVAAGLGAHRRAQQLLFAHALRRSPEQQEDFFAGFFGLDPDAASGLEAAGLLEHVDVAPLVGGPLPIPLTGARAGGDAVGAGALTRLPTPDERVDCQFALVCDKNFVKPTFATMISVLAQVGAGRSVRFVILGDGLGPAEERRLRSLEDTAYDVEVRVHDVTPDLDRDVGREGHKRARATYGRVYLVDFLPEQRTIYLDGDILAARDVSELFDLDLGDACLAGVPDSAALRMAADGAGVPIEQRMRLTGITGEDPPEYLNAGVLVLDLDHPDFRELALRARAHVAMEGRVLAQHDQDAINLAFHGRKHRLPSSYNYMTQFYTSERCLDGDLVSLKYSAADASLIHFSGKVKPWLTREDEFYNGLYRRLVAAAEEKVGVSCEFYFSRPAPDPQRSAEAWDHVLTPTVTLPAVEITPRSADVELVDVTDRHVYLRVAPETYERALAGRLRLVARSGDRTLFELGLDRLSAQQAHLRERVAPGVRFLPVDLPAALAAQGGVARQVELLVAAPDGEAGGFERSLGMIDALASGAAATSALLEEIGVDGKVEALSDGFLRGWYRAEEVPVSLVVAGELVSTVTPPRQKDGTRRFELAVDHLVPLGYGSDADAITVRLSGTNIPLGGGSWTVADVRSARSARESVPTADAEAASLSGRVRHRLARTRSRISGRGAQAD